MDGYAFSNETVFDAVGEYLYGSSYQDECNRTEQQIEELREAGYVTTGKVGHQRGFHFYDVYITEEGKAALAEWCQRYKEEMDRLNAQIAGFS